MKATAAASAEQLLEIVGDMFPRPGRSKEIRLQHLARFLRWAVEKKHLDAKRWTPPATVNAVVGKKQKKGRYAEGSERMRSKQDRAKAEAAIAKFKAAMAEKSASPAKNRWKAAAAKARASAAQAGAGEAKSGEAPMPAHFEAPLPAPTSLRHPDEHPAPPPPARRPPRHRHRRAGDAAAAVSARRTCTWAAPRRSTWPSRP